MTRSEHPELFAPEPTPKASAKAERAALAARRREWVESVVEYIRTGMVAGEPFPSPFTVEDLRRWWTRLLRLAPDSPTWYGLAIRAAYKAGIIAPVVCECCGQQIDAPSTRPETHRTTVKLWRRT